MITLVALLLQVEPQALQAAELACYRDVDACPEFNRLKAEKKASDDAQAEAGNEVASRVEAQELEQARAEDRAADDAEAKRLVALKAKCGKNYMKLRVGMSWKIARACTGMEWSARAEDRTGVVYEASGGFVRVEKGIVVKWVAPR